MKNIIKPEIALYFFLLLLGAGGFFFTVVWPYAEGFYAFIASAALGGFGVALYISHTKRYQKNLICPLGSDCGVVIQSKYSRFFGIPLEYLGMFYYALILVSYAFLFYAPNIRGGTFFSALQMFTAAAFLFSLYLLFVQAFLLRQWCIWCLLSASLSVAIFIISFASHAVAGTWLAGLAPLFMLVKTTGFVFGAGGATAAVFLFFSFLKDRAIDDREADALKGITELIWLGLGLIFISTYALYAAHPEEFARSGSFIIQMIALSVTVVAGAVLKILFAPFLAVLPFDSASTNASQPSILGSIRRAMLITGACALASWYFAFVVDHLPEYELSIWLAAYGATLVAAFIASHIFDRGFR